MLVKVSEMVDMDVKVDSLMVGRLISETEAVDPLLLDYKLELLTRLATGIAYLFT